MADEERTRRIGANEAVFRKVNEQIEDLNRGIAELSDGTMEIVCECGDIRCTTQIRVDVGAYERVRSDSSLFFTVEGHEAADVENVVERTSEYQVVRKRSGVPARVAAHTDSRS
jgi:hypothetical protein